MRFILLLCGRRSDLRNPAQSSYVREIDGGATSVSRKGSTADAALYPAVSEMPPRDFGYITADAYKFRLQPFQRRIGKFPAEWSSNAQLVDYADTFVFSNGLISFLLQPAAPANAKMVEKSGLRLFLLAETSESLGLSQVSTPR